MKFQGQATEDIVAALKRRGFTYRRKYENGWLCFDGQFSTNGVAHRIQLSVSPNFDEPPSIRLIGGKSALILPHLNPDGELCYIAKGSLVFDWFNALENTIACVDRAEKVLADVLAGKHVEDLEQEFFAYWGESDFCFYDFDPGAHEVYGTSIRAYAFPHVGKNLNMLVTDDRMRSHAKLKAMGWGEGETEVKIVTARTSISPYPNQSGWPPQTVNDILTWQRQLSLGFARHLKRLLLSAYSKNGQSLALVIIESPKLPYAFLVHFEETPQKVRLKALLPPLLEKTVIPLRVIRIDDGYIAQRNLVGGKSLAGKRIVLIGCGTIGGYLADMLVKAGVGTSGGKLTLVDPDMLGPQNIGRHRLGHESMFKRKSLQLKEELVRSSPGANIFPVVNDAKNVDFGHIDLLIDATGEQALTEWLTWRFSNKNPILACWVEGPGSAARALIKADPEHGCSRCLSQKNNSHTYRVFKNHPENVLQGYGCENLYVPFPASASIQAAALAMEMVQSWLNGASGATLRSRALDQGLEVHFLDGVLPRAEGCPACSS
ncbi:ThiF family adenylyltransferase [Delftia acidovorans]|uniref:ThiF family adenylyltransferase n=1 Tax=Delftia acidovorans TaxID=80866 RepID=UPI001EFED50D|nr:E2/UBC family protein [Delftia acidovorans]MCG8986230.1 ThiF family adenylyltransferase [Delftia acidovorans]